MRTYVKYQLTTEEGTTILTFIANGKKWKGVPEGRIKDKIVEGTKYETSQILILNRRSEP